MGDLIGSQKDKKFVDILINKVKGKKMPVIGVVDKANNYLYKYQIELIDDLEKSVVNIVVLKADYYEKELELFA